MGIHVQERNSPLSQLLPYHADQKRDKHRTAALREYQLLLKATQQTIEALEQGHFEQFDALVGDNMCQIRAMSISLKAETLLRSFNEIKSQVNQALADSESVKLSPKGSLQEVIDEGNLTVMLREEEAFLIQSYLLTLIKVPRAAPFQRDTTQTKHLQRLGQVTGNFTQALVQKMRQSVATTSVAFVRACAHRLPEREYYLSTVSEECEAEQNHCPSLPFFAVNDILMKQALSSDIPLVLYVDQLASDRNNEKVATLCLLFKKNVNDYARCLVPNEKERHSPAFIVQGFMHRTFDNMPTPRKAIQLLENEGAVPLILMNSASHRQSLDPTKETMVIGRGGERFAAFQKDALEKGCALGKADLFYIDHAFCGLIDHQHPLQRKSQIAEFCSPFLNNNAIKTIIEYEEEF